MQRFDFWDLFKAENENKTKNPSAWNVYQKMIFFCLFVSHLIYLITDSTIKWIFSIPAWDCLAVNGRKLWISELYKKFNSRRFIHLILRLNSLLLSVLLDGKNICRCSISPTIFKDSLSVIIIICTYIYQTSSDVTKQEVPVRNVGVTSRMSKSKMSSEFQQLPKITKNFPRSRCRSI